MRFRVYSESPGDRFNISKNSLRSSAQGAFIQTQPDTEQALTATAESITGQQTDFLLVLQTPGKFRGRSAQRADIQDSKHSATFCIQVGTVHVGQDFFNNVPIPH